MGAPTPCRGALPERRLSFLGLSSKGSLRFVVQLEVAVVQNQREENVYELVVDIVEDDPVGLALGFHALVVLFKCWVMSYGTSGCLGQDSF